MQHANVSSLTTQFLEPLCDATKELFRPVKLSATDRIGLSVGSTGDSFVAEVYGITSMGHKSYPSYGARQWIERIPERKALTGPGAAYLFELAGTDFTALIINGTWPDKQLIFDDEARLLYDFLLTRFFQQNEVSKQRASFKLDPTNTDIKFTYTDHPGLPLSPYQRVGFNGCINQEAAALFMEQGTGKTPIVIARICNEAEALWNAPNVDREKLRKAETFEASIERLISEQHEKLLADAADKVKSKRDSLLAACELRLQHCRDTLKMKLGAALNDASAEVLGRGDQDVASQAADVMIKRLNMVDDQNDRENAKMKWELLEAELLKSAEVTMKCFREELTLKAAEMKAAAELPVSTTEKRMYRALIVCPKNVRMNWRNEFMRFATTEGKVVILRGGLFERMKLLIEAFQATDGCKWTAVVCSYESVQRTWDALKMIEWDIAVADESHYIKGWYTQRAKRMHDLRELAKQRMCLTGTPIANNLLDLYSQFEFLGKGLSGFSTWKAFAKYYGKWEKKEHGQTLIGYQNLPLLQERLARLSFIVHLRDAMPYLPDKVYSVQEVYMTPRQAQVYAELRDQLAIEAENALANADGGNRSLIARCILVKLLRLAQITSGFVCWDPQFSDDGETITPQTVEFFDPSPKLDALVELLKKRGPNEKTLVWACWVPDIQAIAGRLQDEGIRALKFYGGTSDQQREVVEKAYNSDPTMNVFVGNPAAGGTGLNLLGYDYWNEKPTLNTNTTQEVYYSQTWSSVHRSQSEARGHRRGSRTQVSIVDLVVPGTIDEEIRARVVQKQVTALAIQDVRDIMRRLLDAVPVTGDD